MKFRTLAALTVTKGVLKLSDYRYNQPFCFLDFIPIYVQKTKEETMNFNGNIY